MYHPQLFRPEIRELTYIKTEMLAEIDQFNKERRTSSWKCMIGIMIEIPRATITALRDFVGALTGAVPVWAP